MTTLLQLCNPSSPALSKLTRRAFIADVTELTNILVIYFVVSGNLKAAEIQLKILEEGQFPKLHLNACKGLLAFLDSDYAQALKYFQACVMLCHTLPSAFFISIAVCYYHLGYHDHAISALRQINESDELAVFLSISLINKSGQIDFLKEGLSKLKLLHEKAHFFESFISLHLANHLFFKKNYKKCLDLLTKLDEKQLSKVHAAEILFVLGKTLHSTGQDFEAKTYYERSVNSHPLPHVVYLLCQLDILSDKSATAISRLSNPSFQSREFFIVWRIIFLLVETIAGVIRGIKGASDLPKPLEGSSDCPPECLCSQLYRFDKKECAICSRCIHLHTRRLFPLNHTFLSLCALAVI